MVFEIDHERKDKEMPKFDLESADYGLSTGEYAQVQITMQIEGKSRTTIGIDRRGRISSPFEAARKAIYQLTGFCPEVHSVTGRVGGGKDAEATVYLKVKKYGKRVIGRASRRDQFNAEIAAYLDAINNLSEEDEVFC